MVRMGIHFLNLHNLGGGEQTKQLFPEEHLKRGGDEKTIILSPGTLFQNKIQHSKNVHK